LSGCEHANLSDISRAKAHNGGIADPATYFACDDGHVFTAPVGSFRVNPWGLHDMLGNVWEWTLDCLAQTQVGAPSDTSPRTDGDCASRINRGGSWTNSPKYVRAAAQHPDLADARTTVLGFRLVEDLPDDRRGSR
jgi:formylglycine-generating enzyme required for sulfatase activity